MECATEAPEQHMAAEEHQDQSHDQLQASLDLRGDGELERDHHHRRRHQGERVPGVPERPEQAGADDCPLLRHEGGHRSHVIGVEGVTQAQHESNSEGACDRDVHRASGRSRLLFGRAGSR
jgi:hypothetical protein